MGTFGGALEARQIDASNGKLTADVTGEVEAEEGVLVIRRIHSRLHLCSAPKCQGDGGAGARHLRDALPALSHITPRRSNFTSSVELVTPVS